LSKGGEKNSNMSAHITEHDNARDIFKMPCPACIEAATVIKEGREFVPEYALHKYTFKQLGAHLNSNKHSREQLIEVAVRAAAFLYRGVFEEREGA
jgi:hypothetical protein